MPCPGADDDASIVRLDAQPAEAERGAECLRHSCGGEGGCRGSAREATLPVRHDGQSCRFDAPRRLHYDPPFAGRRDVIRMHVL